MQRVSYASMYELARFGAKVVHPRALKAGWAGGTPIAVRSTFTDAPGTLVSDVEDERPLVGVAQPAGDAHARPARPAARTPHGSTNGSGAG